MDVSPVAPAVPCCVHRSRSWDARLGVQHRVQSRSRLRSEDAEVARLLAVGVASPPAPGKSSESNSAELGAPADPSLEERGEILQSSGEKLPRWTNLEVCECGLMMFKHEMAPKWRRSSSMGARRRRAFSMTPEGKYGQGMSPMSSPLVNSFSLTDVSVDIEDMVLEPGEKAVEEMAEAVPKVVVAEDAAYGRKVVCDRCLREDCLTVAPTVGYYCKEQVAQHNSLDDCWIIAHGNVYDVTRYLSKHPGGARSILTRAGMDASLDFDFHSKYSKNKLWAKFKIGNLAFCTNPPARRSERRSLQNEVKPPATPSPPASFQKIDAFKRASERRKHRNRHPPIKFMAEEHDEEKEGCLMM